MRALVVLGAFALSTCATPYKLPNRNTPETDRAIVISWELFEAPGNPPHVRFLLPTDIPEEKRCWSEGGRPGFIEAFSGLCVAGVTFPMGEKDCLIEVVIELEEPPSTTALAHELLHCERIRTFAPIPHHSQGSWTAPSDRNDLFYAQVAAANAILESEGL